MKPLDRAKQIMNSLEILTDIGDISGAEEAHRGGDRAGLRQRRLHALGEAARRARTPPTLKDVIALLQEKLQEGTYEYPAELENAIYRLRQFAREGEDYFARKSTLDIGKLARLRPCGHRPLGAARREASGRWRRFSYCRRSRR